MKKHQFFAVALSAALLFAAFQAGRTSAATGCFPDTNAHWAETFICWLKDNAITSGYANGNYGPEDNVTRAQMAVFLQKQAEIPPTTGLIRFNMGPDSWSIYDTDPGTITIRQFDYAVGLASSVASVSQDFMIAPDFPSALYGRDLSLSGVEYCYYLNPLKTLSITKVVITHYSEATSGLAQVATPLVSDSTVRGPGEGCIYYSISPQALGEDSVLGLVIRVAWGASDANSNAVLGRVTLFLRPSATLTAAPSVSPPNTSDSSNSPFAQPFLNP